MGPTKCRVYHSLTLRAQEMKDGRTLVIERPHDFPPSHLVNKYFERMVLSAVITPQVGLCVRARFVSVFCWHLGMQVSTCVCPCLGVVPLSSLAVGRAHSGLSCGCCKTDVVNRLSYPIWTTNASCSSIYCRGKRHVHTCGARSAIACIPPFASVYSS